MNLYRLLIPIALALIFDSCCIHEMPNPPEQEPPPDIPQRQFLLNLRFDNELPPLGEYVYDQGSVGRSRSHNDDASIPHDIRYTINAYGISKAETISRSSDTTIIFTRRADQTLDASFELNIPDGDYRLYIWTDYVEAGSAEDKYYDTRDFEEIILYDRKAHSGSNDWRDAFAGSVETSVKSRADDGTLSRTDIDEATVQMARPMAKYKFVTTDLKRFVEQSQEKARADNSRAPTLDDYRVRMVYSRYMPCSFNMFTNRPADSWTGVTYESTIRRIDENEAEIAFDYVFVNGTETAVTVAVEVYDKRGTLLAAIPAFDVPLKRSKLTVVKGDFLTTKASGSTGINPDFDGQFNIFIQ